MTDHEKMKALMKELGLSNSDLAKELGLKESTVNQRLKPSNPQGFPTWAKSFLYGYKRGKENRI